MPKVGEIDFKSGEEVATDAGQAVETSETTEEKVEETKAEETTVEETKVEATVEEDINSLPQWVQDKLKKTESDKENYKNAALKYKGLSLKKDGETVEEKKEEELPEWDENSKKFQEQTLNQAEQRAEAKAQSVIESVNEKTAIKQFVEQFPKLAEEKIWSEIVSNYNPTNGKGTVDDVLRDLNRALVLAKFENPQLENLTTEDKSKQVANGSVVAKTNSKVTKESNALSPEALRLAGQMRVDPAKLAEEDDSLTAEIQL